MLHVKSRGVWLLCLMAVYAILQLGAGGGGDIVPDMPDPDARFVDLSDTAGHSEIRMQPLEGADMITMFPERFMDRELALQGIDGRASGAGAFSAAMPQTAPVIRQPPTRNQMGGASGEDSIGLFPSSAQPRESTGWGWLADDVQQIRSSSRSDVPDLFNPVARPDMPQPFLNRSDADPDAFRSSRWFDE